MRKEDEKELVGNWCLNHGFPWTLVDDHFYWQTQIQTGEITPDNKIIWHEHEYFDKVVNGILT